MGQKLRDTPEFQRGENTETLIENALKSHGWAVLPVRKWNREGPPVLETDTGTVVLPDILASRSGESVYVEVKHKTEPAYYRKKNQYRHGIPTRLLHEYRTIERVTGVPVYMLIYEANTGYVLGGRTRRGLHDSLVTVQTKAGAGRGGNENEKLAFFKREDLVHYGTEHPTRDEVFFDPGFFD